MQVWTSCIEDMKYSSTVTEQDAPSLASSEDKMLATAAESLAQELAAMNTLQLAVA